MKRKLKILLITPLAAGTILAVDATRSDAFILDTLEGLWNQTTGIVTGALNQYVGQYVTELADLYIPKGINAIAGALGLPDLGEAFKDIRDEALENNTSNNDIAAGDLEEVELTRSFGKAMGEVAFSEQGQENAQKVSELAASLSQSSAEIAKACQGQNITQEKLNCTNQLLANSAQSQQMLMQQLKHQGDLLSAMTMLSAEGVDLDAQEARALQAESDNRAKRIQANAEIYAAMNEGLAQSNAHGQ